jgi:hypothetical protein
MGTMMREDSILVLGKQFHEKRTPSISSAVSKSYISDAVREECVDTSKQDIPFW